MAAGSRKAKGTISRRYLLSGALSAGLAGALGPCLWVGGCARRIKPKMPNIIFIIIDTLRADHLGCCGYGRDTTPNIDKLAGEAKLFTNAIAAAPWTLPSVASILTSQYPCALGIRERIAPVPASYPLLCEVLKQHGYATCGIVSHTLLSGRLGFGRGFDSYDESSSFGHEGISSPAVTRRAVSFLEQDHDRPFFLFLHYFDPHYNFVLHSGYDYYPSYRGRLKSNHSILELWRIRKELSDDDTKYLVSLYDSEIAFTDSHIGVLLGALRRRKLYDNSIVILTADHGEEFMERGWIGHTITLYQELIRVPLIMKFPDVRGSIVEQPVGLIDVAPTVFDYPGLDFAGETEGRALPLEKGESFEQRAIFSATFNPQSHRPEKVEPMALRSVIVGKDKLVYDEKKEQNRMCDLSSDPAEIQNKMGLAGEGYKGLRKTMADWISRMEVKRKELPSGHGTELLTPEQREQLKSLGYL